jgi:hypothetical protein
MASKQTVCGLDDVTSGMLLAFSRPCFYPVCTIVDVHRPQACSEQGTFSSTRSACDRHDLGSAFCLTCLTAQLGMQGCPRSRLRSLPYCLLARCKMDNTGTSLQACCKISCHCHRCRLRACSIAPHAAGCCPTSQRKPVAQTCHPARCAQRSILHMHIRRTSMQHTDHTPIDCAYATVRYGSWRCGMAG